MKKSKSQHVQVFVRTRPTARAFDGLRVHKDGESITVAFPKEAAAGVINNQLDSLTFKFDGVLDNVSQEVVYDTCARDAVDSVLSGYNATVFCFGQTGAGKTFTMAGDAAGAYAHRGIIPRALHHIFRAADLRVSDRLYRLAVSYMEVANEVLYDLLAEQPAASADSLAVLDDAGGTVVRGLTRVEVGSEEEALAQWFLGEQGRSTSATVLNACSSRSHALFTVHVEARASADARERALLSKLHLVDLAGSERPKKSGADGDALREAAAINKSLSYLEQVVNALARRDAHVPFRQSKLTSVLRDALGGNCKTVMIANLWPQQEHLQETASTLRFASRVRCLETDAVVNESPDPLLALRKAERQLNELRQELAMRDMLSGRGRVMYEDLSESEQHELQQLVAHFLAGGAELDELPTDSLKRIKETYKAFRVVAAQQRPQCAPPESSTASSQQQGAAGEQDTGVGVVDATHSGGFCVGSAPVQARPAASPRSPQHAAAEAAVPRTGGAAAAAASGAATLRQQQQQRAQQQQSPPPVLARSLPPSQQKQQQQQQQQQQPAQLQGAAPDRNAAFSKFKATAGKQQAQLVKQQQQCVAALKQQVKDVGGLVNSSKAEIDALVASSTAADGRALDGQGLQQQLKTAKTRYRGAFEELGELRGQLQGALDGLAAAKEALLASFDAWLALQPVVPAGDGSTQQIAAWWASGGGQGGGAADGADSSCEGEEEELEPSLAYERLDLARHTATEPDSAAFWGARKQASRLRETRAASPGATRRGAA